MMKKKSTSPLILFLFASLICNVAFAQWQKTAGPPGITVTKFFENNNALFAGTSGQGVYKSYDHGNTWVAANTGIEKMQILSLTGDSLYVYAGTGFQGVYRSADQGATWTAANTGIQTLAVSSLLSAAGYMFAGTTGAGIYISADHGDSWQDANGGALGSSSIYAMFYANARLTVEADNYLFYSFDLGATWNVDNGSTQFNVIDNFLQKGDTVIASAKGNVFVTHDGGTTWSNAIVLNTGMDIDILGLGSINDTIYAGYANGFSGGYATGVYRSTDWGQTWSAISSSGLRFGNRFDNQFKISGNNFLFSCEAIGIYASNDKGVTWVQVPLSNFEVASTIDNCLLVSGNTLYSGTHDDGVYSSANNGNSWTKTGTTNPLDTLSNSIIFAMLNPAPDILLAGACGNGLYRSVNNGSTWKHITNGLPSQDGTGYCCIKALAKSGNKTIAATDQGIYYSTDNGLSWTASNLTSTSVDALSLAVNENVVCAGISSFSRGDGIYRSTNGGISWDMANNSIPDVISLAAGGANHFYAGTFSGNYVSDDNGLSWQNVGPGIPATDPGFAILAFDGYVFIGNNNGIYFSSNYAGLFTSVSTGMDPYPDNAVQGLAADSNFIYAGMFQDGVWRRPLSDFGFTTGISALNTQQHDFIVSPNPATTEINISGISFNSGDKIIITDALGKIVYKTESRNSSLNFKVQTLNFSKGVYFVKVQNNRGTTVQKFIKE